MKYFIAASLFTLSGLYNPAITCSADLDSGRLLFNTPSLGGGTTGKTCATCHEDGLGLSKKLSAGKKFKVMDIEQENIHEVVNFCIEVTLRGEGLADDQPQMDDLVEYLKYLSKKGRKAGKHWTD